MNPVLSDLTSRENGSKDTLCSNDIIGYMELLSIYSELADIISAIDSKILLTANAAHSSALDKVMWLLSDRWFWIPLYIFLAFWTYRQLGLKRCLVVLTLITLLIFVTDQTCAHVIRPYIGRMRPTCLDNPLSEIVRVVNNYRGGRFGFPSCHAANTFALAVFLSLCIKNKVFSVLIIIWAFVVAYSRLYLGVHYPGDIIVGWIIGCTFACLTYTLYRFIDKKYLNR